VILKNLFIFREQNPQLLNFPTWGFPSSFSLSVMVSYIYASESWKVSCMLPCIKILLSLNIFATKSSSVSIYVHCFGRVINICEPSIWEKSETKKCWMDFWTYFSPCYCPSVYMRCCQFSNSCVCISALCFLVHMSAHTRLNACLDS